MRASSFWVVLALLGGLLAGCGGGGGGSEGAVQVAAPAPESGTLAITITDAEGDFDAYEVDVTSVVLHGSDGTVVETLPLTTRIDFAELTEVTAFLNVATVPAGRYQAASLGLDFTDADIVVQDELGDLHQATPVDEDGNPLGELSVRLQLTDSDSIVIRPGVPAAFSLDFDLDASNTIDLTPPPPASGPVVTVLPFLLASAELEEGRAHRVRGGLRSVNEAEMSVTVNVRPFRHRTGDFGQFTFFTTDDTLYEIDGAGYSGDAGLAALAALPDGAPIIAAGPVEEGSLVAETVLAGSSVPWTDHDVAKGVVVGRQDDTLTLAGVVVGYADGEVVRRDRVAVLLGDQTRVTALGLDNAALSKDSISVGQRVVAFGELSDDGTLDASQDHVRMRLSDLTAQVMRASPLAVDVHFQNGRRPAAYDYTGTGVDPDHDADPTFYEIDTQSLPLSSVDTGDLVRVRGHVNAWASAPADFLAQALIDVSLDMRAAGFIGYWPEATSEPLLAVDSARIELDLAQARSLLKLRGVPLELTNPLASLLLVAPDSGRGVYAVRVRGSGEIHLYREFSGLVDEILRQLESGRLMKVAAAQGRYNESPESLTAGRAGFDFIDPGV
jgi:hypothetical protein